MTQHGQCCRVMMPRREEKQERVTDRQTDGWMEQKLENEAGKTGSLQLGDEKLFVPQLIQSLDFDFVLRVCKSSSSTSGP